MAEISALVYGWVAGIIAVIVWILYGIDTLLQLMRIVNDAFSHLPGLSHLAYDRKGKKKGGAGSGRDGGTTSQFNVLTNDEGLEGLAGSTKRVTPITAGGLCLMSWYGPDGTTGPPIECRLALENNEVTIYQLLRIGDTNTGMPGGAAGAGSPAGAGGKRLPTGQTAAPSLAGRRGSKDVDTNAFRSAAGVTVAEHRKGRVSVLHTTVMELRHFNKPHKGAGGGGGEQSGGGDKANTNNNGSKANHRKGSAAAGSGSEVDSAAPSQRGSVAATPNGSQHRRKESGDEAAGGGNNNGNNNNNNNNSSSAPLEGTTRPGVDPLFNGRVLIWRTMDGCPLFDSIGAAQHNASNATFGGSMRRGNASSASAPNMSHSASMDSLSDDRSFNSSMGDGEGSDHGEEDATNDGSGGEGGGQHGRKKQQQQHHGHNHHTHHGHHSGRRHSKSNAEMNDMANWSCVIIKFERARESEWWHTLLSGLKEARAWHDFAKTLPNPDTVNTFLSRFFFQNMRVNGLADAIIKQIRKKLRELPAKKFPRDLGGQLILDEFLIGTQIPWITDVSEPTVSANGEVGFDFNLMYKGGEGGFTLFFRLALEFLGIRVPHVVFSVKLIELEATVHISIGPPPSKKFWIGGHKPPVLRLEVHQGCASGKGILHRVLTSLPDLSGIMTNLIKLYLFSDMVLPYMDDFPLPSVVKSPKSSMRDLRVRTFDRQRAAKISGAPVRSSSAPVAAPPSPLTDPPATTPGAEADAATKAATAAPSSQRPFTAAVATGTPGPPPKSSKPNTPRNNNASGEAQHAPDKLNASRRSSGNQSLGSTTNNVQNVASPISLLSPNNPNAGSFTGGRANNTSSTVPNTSALSANNTMTSSMLNRTMQSETDLTESEEALSATGRKRGGGSGTMRNLKNLLKVKGSDMTRESVSRSKGKGKT